MKVIFLNVDGVLTHSEQENYPNYDLMEEKVMLVKQICEATGAKVVMNSVWVKLKKVYDPLLEIFNKNGIEIIDESKRCCFGTSYADAIKEWLSENPVESFVILNDDDCYWDERGLSSNLVQTNFYDGGLKPEHVVKAIEILNKI